jgi:hypothetical protein
MKQLGASKVLFEKHLSGNIVLSSALQPFVGDLGLYRMQFPML